MFSYSVFSSLLWFLPPSHSLIKFLFKCPRSHQGMSRRRLSTPQLSVSHGVPQVHNSSMASTKDTRWMSIHCPLVVKRCVTLIKIVSLLPIYVTLRQQQDSHWLVLSDSGHICPFFPLAVGMGTRPRGRCYLGYGETQFSRQCSCGLHQRAEKVHRVLHQRAMLHHAWGRTSQYRAAHTYPRRQWVSY